MNLRLAHVMAALSVATDLGMGQPLEFALASCIAAVRLGERVGLSDADLRAAYYFALLRYIGCNAETHLLASVFGDELAFRTNAIHADPARPEFLAFMMRFIRQANAGASPIEIVSALAGGITRMGQTRQEFFEGHCQVAQRLAERIGLEPEIVNTLSQVYARWDGKGIPALKGEAISPAMLVVSLTQDAVFFARIKLLQTIGSLPNGIKNLAGGLLDMLGQTSTAGALRLMQTRNVSAYFEMVERLIDYRETFRAALDKENIDIILSPVMPLPAFTHRASGDLGVAGSYTVLYNVLRYPAGVVPITRVRAEEQVGHSSSKDSVERLALKIEENSTGLPIGVQIAARPWREHVALAVMNALQTQASSNPDFPHTPLA